MNYSKKIVNYTPASGVGIVRDKNGKLAVVYNTSLKSSELKPNASITVRSYQGKDYTT